MLRLIGLIKSYRDLWELPTWSWLIIVPYFLIFYYSHRTIYKKKRVKKSRRSRRRSRKLGNVIYVLEDLFPNSRSGASDDHPMLPVSLFGIVSGILCHPISSHTTSNHLNDRRWSYLSNYDIPSNRQSKLTTFQPLIRPMLAHRGAQHSRVGYPGWEAKNIQLGISYSLSNLDP